MIKLLVLLLIITNNLFAQNLPVKLDRTNQIKHYNGFTLSYNELHEQANWVFYTPLIKISLFCTDAT